MAKQGTFVIFYLRLLICSAFCNTQIFVFLCAISLDEIAMKNIQIAWQSLYFCLKWSTRGFVKIGEKVVYIGQYRLKMSKLSKLVVKNVREGGKKWPKLFESLHDFSTAVKKTLRLPFPMNFINDFESF